MGNEKQACGGFERKKKWQKTQKNDGAEEYLVFSCLVTPFPTHCPQNITFKDTMPRPGSHLLVYLLAVVPAVFSEILPFSLLLEPAVSHFYPTASL